MAATCLYCYGETGPYEGNFHITCSRKFFKTYPPPQLTFSAGQIRQLNATAGLYHMEAGKGPGMPKSILPHKSGTLEIRPEQTKPLYLPALEDLCFKLATEVGIDVLPHTLFENTEEELVLLVKYPAQPSIALDLNKAQTGSYEQMVKAIEKTSAQPGLDKVYFAERLLFAFFIGNAFVQWDTVFMTRQNDGRLILAPMQQAVSSALFQPALANELNLQLAGKRTGITEQTFDRFFERIELNTKVADTVKRKFSANLRNWFDIIETGFLPERLKRNFIHIIIARAERMNML